MTLDSGDQVAVVCCPRCQSERVWKDGLRKDGSEPVQRYTCRDCGYRFSEGNRFSEVLNGPFPLIDRQVCDIGEESKNLTVATVTRATEDVSQRDQILVHFEYELRKEGLAKSTIDGYTRSIKSLLNNNVNLLNPDSVKEYLVSLDAEEGRKRNIVHAYKQYYRMLYGKRWLDAPRYERKNKPQHLPTEELLLMIIAAVPNKYKPFCQLLMETGARSIEAWTLKWSAFDLDRRMVAITPAKNGNPRDLPISDRLIAMLRMLPRTSEYVFMAGKQDHFREGFRKHRARLAAEFGEPGILRCSFKTFRTFNATKTSHKFHDPYEVKYRLGHVLLRTTDLYVRREGAMRREWVSRTTRTVEEAKEAVEQDFEYVTDVDDVKVWRKPV